MSFLDIYVKRLNTMAYKGLSRDAIFHHNVNVLKPVSQLSVKAVLGAKMQPIVP